VDDGSQVDSLLDQVGGPLASFTGDGAYDQDGVTSSVTERHPEAAIIVPPRANAVPSDTATTTPIQRDRHLQQIAKHGRLAWQAASGYTKRARAETGMSRFKHVIGDGLRSHTDERQATEVDVAVHVLNACWSWDARTPSASPKPRWGWGQCVHFADPCNNATLSGSARSA
jgi:hypothetical protein